MPSFQGGDINTFARWISDRLEYPPKMNAKGVRGRVVARFVLEKDGSINQVEILESPYLLLSAEVIRVLGLSPKWTPARNEEGEPVRVYMMVPVNFTMPPDPRKDKSLPPQIRQGVHGN